MKLRDYLTKEKMTIEKFVFLSCLSKTTLQHVLRGEAISKHTADLIIHASHGEVTEDDLKIKPQVRLSLNWSRRGS